jgi:hypothetical protein
MRNRLRLKQQWRKSQQQRKSLLRKRKRSRKMMEMVGRRDVVVHVVVVEPKVRPLHF